MVDDFILDESGEGIFDEAGGSIEAEAQVSVVSRATLPALRHRDVLAQLMPVALSGPVHEADIAIEGYHLDMAAASAEDMLDNAFAHLAAQLMGDWERVLGLRPSTGATLAERRSASVTKIRARGGLSRRYFIELAAAMGYEIEIYEELTWRWRVHVLSAPDFLNYFRTGESCAGEYLLSFGTPELEEMIIDLKPAHTYVYFSYV